MNHSTIRGAERRRLSREARDAFPPMGVFSISSTARHPARVVSSRNVHGAINRMQFELRLGTHPDKSLQAEWNLGPASISFNIIELAASVCTQAPSCEMIGS